MDHYGVDVSSNNAHPINWAGLYAHLKALGGGGEPFLIIKVTEGTTYVNAEAAQDVVQARAAGFKAVAGYQFDHGTANPAAEQQWANAHSLGLPIFDDIEFPEGLSPAQYAAHARALVALNPGALEYLDGSEVSEGFPADRLWLAQPNNQPGVYSYPCLVHQYTWTGTAPGVNGEFDFNIWRGTEAQFDQFFKLAVPTPSAPSEQVLMWGCVGIAATNDGLGYWLATPDGAVHSHGDSAGPSLKGMILNKPVVAIAANPVGSGCWLAASDGGVFGEKDSGFYGSVSHPLDKPVIAMAAAPKGRGYWLLSSDGGVAAFGTAEFRGNLVGKALAAPLVGIASGPDAAGYLMAAADGGIFVFGSAGFHGSLAGKHLAAPIVAIVSTPTHAGYWLFAADGGVFTFGDASFHGSLGGVKLAQPIVAAASSPSGNGYLMVGRDGGVFAFGDAHFEGAGV